MFSVNILLALCAAVDRDTMLQDPVLIQYNLAESFYPRRLRTRSANQPILGSLTLRLS